MISMTPGRKIGKRDEKVRFKAAHNIEILEKYIRKYLPQEQITRIHSYVMNYINEEESCITASIPPIDKTEIASAKIIQDKAKIVEEIRQYGEVAFPVIYLQYRKISDVKSLLTGPLGEVASYINNKYKPYIKELRSKNIEIDFSPLYHDMEIGDKFGTEYTYEFVSLIMMVIAFELDKLISKEDILQASRLVADRIRNTNISDDIRNLYKSKLTDMIKVFTIISPPIIFKALNYDFIDKSLWPYNDNIIEFMYRQLQGFKFTEKTLTKMQLLNSWSYYGIDVGSSIHLLVLKEMINAKI